MDEENFIGVKEAADFTCLEVGTIYGKIHKNTIPHYKIGHKVVFRKEELKNWMLCQRVLTDEEYEYIYNHLVRHPAVEKRGENDNRRYKTKDRLVQRKNKSV